MKLKIYSVRDRASDAFMNPMYMPANGQAIRVFGDEINRPDDKSPLYHHPEDFDLYYLGEFDASAGTFETSRPEQIAIGKDLAVRGERNGK